MKRTAFWPVLACFLTFWVGLPVFSQPAPRGRAFQLAPGFDGTLGGLALAAASDGRFVAAWGSRRIIGVFPLVFVDDSAVARVFDAAGRPLSPVLRLDHAEGGPVAVSALTLAGEEGFVVVWREGEAVFARPYGLDGRPRRRAFAPVPSEITRRYAIWPAACSDAEGRFVIAWSQGTEIWARRYDAAARSSGPRFCVADGAAGRVTAAMSPDGILAILWVSVDGVLWGRFYAPDGDPLDEPVRIQPPAGGVAPGAPRDLLAQSDGTFLLFRSLPQPAAGVVSFAFRELDVHGWLLGEEQILEVATGVTVSALALALDAREDFLASWSGYSSGRVEGVWGRGFGRTENGRAGLLAPRLAVSEAAGSIEIPVLRTGGNAGALSARVRTRAGSAHSVADFVPIDDPVDFDAGDSQPRIVTLELVDDAVAESVESFRLRLPGAASGSAYAEVAELEIEVRDDDAPPALGTVGPVRAIGDGPVRFNREAEDELAAVLLPMGELVVAARRGWSQFFVDRLGRDFERLDRLEKRDDSHGRGPVALSRLQLATDALGNLALSWHSSLHLGIGFYNTSDWVQGWRAASQAWWPEPFAVLMANHHHYSSYLPGVSVAITSDGRLATTSPSPGRDRDFETLNLLRFDDRGGLLVWEEVPATLGIGGSTRLATLPEGATLAVRPVAFDGDGGGLNAARLPLDGSPAPGPARINAGVDGVQDLPSWVAPLHGRLFAVWRGSEPLTGRQGLWGRWVGDDGQPLGPDLAVSAATRGTIGRSSVAAAADRMVVVWEHTPVGEESSELRAQVLDLEGRALGGELLIPSVSGGAQRQPLATGNLAGDLVVLWVEETGGYEEAMLYAQRLETLPGCAPVALHDGRFELRAVWRSPHAPERGCAQGRATGSPGVATFSFGGTTQDLQVTLYDARRIDGHFWVLSTNTSDFEHALTVIDRASGRSKTYFNPAFEPGARSDRLSFPG